VNKTFKIKDIRESLERQGIGSAGIIKDKSESRGVNFLNREIRLFGSQLPDKAKETFYLELSTLLSAGVDTRSALDMIVEEQTKKKYKIIFESIYQQVIAGAPLSVALKSNKEFTAYEYHSVQIGEETGKLNYILNELAVFYQKKIKQRQQVVGALTYPVMVIAVAVTAVSFMVMYVVPMFADVFRRFGGELPFITKAVLYFADFVKRFFLLFVLFMAGVLLFCGLNRKKDWFRSIVSQMILKTPLIGEIVKKIYLSRFSNTMALLVGSRIPIVQGIGLVKQMIGFYPIECSLQEVEENVIAGLPLHKSLALHTVYPKKMLSLLKAGEEVNKLELFFAKIAEQYNSEVEYQTNMLSKILEPLIIIILGLIVGIILIAMYLPLFKLGQSL